MSINREPGEMSPLLENDDSSQSSNNTARSPDQLERRRQPVDFSSLRSVGSSGEMGSTSAVLHRYRYYSRLAPHTDSAFQMPDHVVPPDFYIVVPIITEGKQSSLITIFSLWNTMMGTSILSMPWAIRQAGFATGISLLLLMAILMFYTSYRILKAMQSMGKLDSGIDFSDVCHMILGRWAQVLAVVSSLLTLLGGAIVYWILLSNFFFNVVNFIYHHSSSPHSSVSNGTDYVCPSMSPPSHHGNHSNHSGSFLASPHPHDEVYDRVWDEQYTVPFFLIAVIGPLINFKSPTFFTKFNALGTLSVTYLVSFVAVKASKWGFHLNFQGVDIPNDLHNIYIPDFRGTFAALTGIAALAYFVQNCVISICRNQRHPENNIRDLTIAYILVAVTYIYMGVMFYSAFPLNKDCIEDNLLNNIADTDIMAFVARIGLFFQMICVFPLLLYIFRAQLLFSLFGDVWPSVKHVLGLNVLLVAVCVVFAVFLPHIGSIIGFVGAFCGFSYAILLPCLVHMRTLFNNGELSILTVVFHSTLILLGLANFIGQFLIIGKT
ncbi:sodium-coupled neutral amino acid transporter 9-like [Crassostrea angulata]|uniref:sodium-coupled neutral amino acid transporter 9-like n=1 Tax=Magallana angulata TaxID=2784310 RepID=UPI0022B16E89|nr:sodium-coupled neutral amino acid transporter 9-like [Crassostrea angulata]